MTELVWFAPVEPNPPVGLLARYRPPEMSDAARWFAAQFTAPGDLVLDLFCHGPGMVRQVARSGRRVVGANVNPLLLLAAGLELEPLPEPTALKAAFTRLADRPKGNQPLRRHLADLYASRCPACSAPGVAVWFAWDREAHYPYRKAVDCPRCTQVEEGPTDEADINRARQFKPRGLAYHYFLNRVAPPDHPARERAGELVGLYTPRNLSALMDVAIYFDELSLDRRVQAALQAMLVTAFDRCSSLDLPGEGQARPRILRPPTRFLEWNVWRVLERELARLTDGKGTTEPAVERVTSLEALLGGRSPGYVLLPAATQEVVEQLPGGEVALILADPPRRDAVFWALSALWAGWLWDQPMAHAMRPFLPRRRFDWVWHRRALRAALAGVAPLLNPAGRLVTLFDHADEGLLEAICQASSAAGYRLLGWGCHPQVGYHLVWRFESARRVQARPEESTDDVWQASRAARAAELAQRCLIRRGEPTPRSIVHAAACTSIAAERDLAGRPFREAIREGMRQAGLQQAGDRPTVWLPALDASAETPLADRIERAVWEAFQVQPEWAEEDLLRWIVHRFSGPLSPGRSLVHACIASYGRQEAGRWRMRPEDHPDQRDAEIERLRTDLRTLGRQLGFEIRGGHGWDMRWSEAGEDEYLYLLSPTVELGRHLLTGPSVPAGACPCLVFPGGRAELLVHKLQGDPRLSQVAQEKGWEFIKFRHLRRLIAEGLDRRSFEAVLGLDPVVGQEGVQIPMLLGSES